MKYSIFNRRDLDDLSIYFDILDLESVLESFRSDSSPWFHGDQPFVLRKFDTSIGEPFAHLDWLRGRSKSVFVYVFKDLMALDFRLPESLFFTGDQAEDMTVRSDIVAWFLFLTKELELTPNPTEFSEQSCKGQSLEDLLETYYQERLRSLEIEFDENSDG